MIALIDNYNAKMENNLQTSLKFRISLKRIRRKITVSEYNQQINKGIILLYIIKCSANGCE